MFGDPELIDWRLASNPQLAIRLHALLAKRLGYRIPSKVLGQRNDVFHRTSLMGAFPIDQIHRVEARLNFLNSKRMQLRERSKTQRIQRNAH